MKFGNYIVNLATAALLLLSMNVQAAVINPKLDIHDIGTGDTGITFPHGNTFDINATVFQIVTDSGLVDIADLDFILNSSGTYAANTGAYSGTLRVGDTGSEALMASFSNLMLFSNALGGQFFADLTYTGGYLAGDLSGGRLEGSYTLHADGSYDGMVAKLGPVVPIPAAVWLFGSGLIGLIAVARRKTA